MIICRTEIFGKAKTFFIYNEKLSLTRQFSSGHCLRQLDGKDHVPLPTEKFTIDMCVVDLLFLILIIILFEFRSWRDVLDTVTCGGPIVFFVYSGFPPPIKLTATILLKYC